MNISQVTKQVQKAKKQIQDAFDPEDISGITYQGYFGKEIKGISNQFKTLKGQKIDLANMIDLSNYKRKIEEAKIEADGKWQEISSKQGFKYDTNSIQKYINDYKYAGNEVDKVKGKVSQLKQETAQMATTQSKLGSFFSAFKQKVEQIKPSISSIGNSFKRLPKITQNITNHIKGMGTGIKQGLGHVLKYAGALLSLRGIYSILSSCAQSWLSSQNAGAQQLSANIDYMKYAMGSALAPVIQFVTNLVYQLMKAIQSVAYALTGVNIFAKASASSYASMAGSAKKAKDETKQLAGIHDEINNVQTNKNSGGGTAPSFDLSQMDNTPNSIINAIKNGNWYEVGETIGQKLNDAMNSIPWNKIQNTAKKIGTGIAQTLNGFIAKTNWSEVGNTFAQGLNTIIYFGYNFVTTFDWKQFGKAIGDSINGFFNNIDWATAGQTLSKGIKGALNSINIAISEIDWYQIGQDIKNFLINIDWSGICQELATVIGKALGGLVELVIGMLGDFWKEQWEENFQKKIEECGGNIVAGLFLGIVENVAKGFQWLWDNFVKPLIDGFCEMLGIHSPSTVFEEFGKNIVEGLFNGLSGIWEKVSSIFTNLVTKVGEKFTEIKNNIGTWASNTKETIKNWGDTAKAKISECWENASEKVKEKVNTIKNNISTGLSDAKTNITTWSSNIKTSWGEHWNNMSNTVKSGLNTAKSNISSWGSNIGKTFSDIGNKASTWGKDLVSNLASGIRNNISKVTSAVTSVANNIKSYLHFTEPDVGPLSNFHTYMPDMIDLMVQGIHGNMGKVTEELENLTSTMSYTINSPDISPIPFENTKNNTVQLRSSILDNLSDMLNRNEQNVNITIPLTVQVGNKKLGEILLEDLRDKTRQTGKNLEALVGG